MDQERTRPALAPTGDARVDQAIEGLSDLDQIDLDERPAVLEEVHDRLREILGELGDAGRQAQGAVAPAARVSPAARASRACFRLGSPPDRVRRARCAQARRAERRRLGSAARCLTERGATLMPTRARLDSELVRRGLARSREQAAELIAAGRVAVSGQTASKSATQVTKDTPVTVAEDDDGDAQYVSRGGHKLAGALEAFAGLSVAGKRCLDAGASTGGFTDVLLRAGAAQVVAADVGYGQLAWSLRTDERVTVLDRVNVRALEPAQVAPPPEVVVADLSFISLTKVLPALVACAALDADFALMVKPQFELGKGRVPGGVVRSQEDRAEAVRTVAAAAAALGLGVLGVTASPLPGPAGNVEYFVWFRAGAPALDEAALQDAIKSGPQ